MDDFAFKDKTELVDLDTKHQHIYSLEAPHYDDNRFMSRRGSLYNYFEQQAIIRLLEPLNGRRVLDVASGTGRIALSLARYGANVTAVDLTWEMLATARSKCNELRLNNLSFATGNARQLPFENNAFDIVTCVRFLHLLPVSTWGWFFGEMKRVLKPDGLMMIELYNPLYGGPLAIFYEGIRWLRKKPGEKYVWPFRYRVIFSDLDILSITSFWLPGMGLLAREDSSVFNWLSRACSKQPLNWIAGPHLVLSRSRV